MIKVFKIQPGEEPQTKANSKEPKKSIQIICIRFLIFFVMQFMLEYVKSVFNESSLSLFAIGGMAQKNEPNDQIYQQKNILFAPRTNIYSKTFF